MNTGAPNEVWSFGDEVLGTLVEHLEMRERLRDYSRDLMREAHERGTPVLRGLFYEFPDDPETWSVTDQYLYGPDLLVCPVVELGSRARRVYLPAGASWTELATGTSHAGGRWLEVDAPLERIPVFGREGRRGGL